MTVSRRSLLSFLACAPVAAVAGPSVATSRDFSGFAPGEAVQIITPTKSPPLDMVDWPAVRRAYFKLLPPAPSRVAVRHLIEDINAMVDARKRGIALRLTESSSLVEGDNRS